MRRCHDWGADVFQGLPAPIVKDAGLAEFEYVSGSASFDDCGKHYKGLFRPVPVRCLATAAFCSNRHGPTGGHDRIYQQAERALPRFFDFLDVLYAVSESFGVWWLGNALWMQTLCASALCSAAALALLALALVLISACGRQSRAIKALCFGGAPGAICRAFVVLLVAHHAEAAPSSGSPRIRSAVPMPTDLELWAAGQMTRAEQLAEALRRHFVEQSLSRAPRERSPPRWAAPAPDTLPAEEMPTMDELGMHITAWVATPYYTAETVDILVPRPLTLAYLTEAIKNATSEIPDTCEVYRLTFPQLGDHFASYVAHPAWLQDSGKFVLILDTRAIGGAPFAFYAEAPLNYATILANLPDCNGADYDFYVFGSRERLRPERSVRPIDGGVIKVLPQGGQCHWPDELEARLGHPERWLHSPPPPGELEGLHYVYQSSEDQVVQEISDTDERPLEEAASDALMLGYDCITFLPEERLERLSHGGRHIWDQVAVLNASDATQGQATIIFLDLRPIGFFHSGHNSRLIPLRHRIMSTGCRLMELMIGSLKLRGESRLAMAFYG